MTVTHGIVNIRTLSPLQDLQKWFPSRALAYLWTRGRSTLLPEAPEVVTPALSWTSSPSLLKLIASWLHKYQRALQSFQGGCGQRCPFDKNGWANFGTIPSPGRQRKFETPVKVVHLFMLVELKPAYNLSHTVNKTSEITEDLKRPSLFYQPKGQGLAILAWVTSMLEIFITGS